MNALYVPTLYEGNCERPRLRYTTPMLAFISTQILVTTERI